MSLGIPLAVEMRRCGHCNTLVSQEHRREYTRIDGRLHTGAPAESNAEAAG